MKYYSDEDTAVRCLDSKLILLAGAARGDKLPLEFSFNAPIIACELLTRPKRDQLEPDEKKHRFAVVFEKGEPTYELCLYEWAFNWEAPAEYHKVKLADEKVFQLRHSGCQ